MFDLGKVSTYLPELKFELATLIKPMAQQNDFGAGEYCFEVTAYSENAPPTRGWYLVMAHDLHSPNPITVEQMRTAVGMRAAHSHRLADRVVLSCCPA
jgi:hypothetical protein